MADSDCKLLSLPAEIRNMIYELVLNAVESDKFGFVNIKRRSKDTVPSVVSITRTCKQIYGEAPPIFYAAHYISIGHLQLKTYFDAIGPRCLISTSRICICDRMNHLQSVKFLNHLPRLPNLKTLAIKLSDSSFDFYGSKLDPTEPKDLQSVIEKLPNLHQIRIIVPTQQDGDRRYEWSEENLAWERVGI